MISDTLETPWNRSGTVDKSLKLGLTPWTPWTTRVGRIFALRYEGLEQQLKFGQASSQSPADLKSMSDRIETVESDAISMGY
jgi:hypothetical protein